MACYSIQTLGGMSRHTIILQAVKTSHLLCHKTTLSNIQMWRCVLAQSKPLLWGECHRKTIISSTKHDQCFITLCFSHCSSAQKELIHQISNDIYIFPIVDRNTRCSGWTLPVQTGFWNHCVLNSGSVCLLTAL